MIAESVTLSMVLSACALAGTSDVSRRAATVLAETSISNMVYCKGDQDVDVLQMQLSIRVTNIGKRDVLHSGDASVGALRVLSPEDEDAVARVIWEFPLHPMGTHTTDLTRVRALAPGQSFTFRSRMPVFVQRAGYTGALGIPAGEYRISLTLHPFPGGPSDSANAASKLADRGDLWVEPTQTLPMKFEVLRDRTVADCDK